MDIKITSKDSGRTIRDLLRNELGFSSSMLKKVKFSPGGINVNGEFRTVRYELCEGDVLSVAVEDNYDDVSPYIIPVDIPIEIIYEDEYYTVINKPPHMPSHPSFGHREDTVANALAFHHKGTPFVFRPVNRLDADTSGAMVVANSKLSSYTLNKVMAEGGIKKTYIAVLDAVPEENENVIDTYLRRVDQSIIKREVCKENEGGKRAVTHYRVLCENNGKALVVVKLMTGRTHQIRVHFAHIGTPVLGDTLYGKASDKIDRQALHSYTASFVHPKDVKEVHYTAGFPNDLHCLIKHCFGNDAFVLLKEII